MTVGQPGSAPPIREVTDAEVARHSGLVHMVVNGLYRKHKIASDVEREDLIQVGMWAVWEALRRWKPERGAQSTYLSSYIWGYVMKYQRDVTKAVGFNRSEGCRTAQVVSYEETIVEDVTIASTLAAPDDTEDAGMWAAALDELVDRLRALPPRDRAIVRHMLGGWTLQQSADELGLSRETVRQLRLRIGPLLARVDEVRRRTGTILVDRVLHETEDAACREAQRIRPGCTVVSVTPRKLRRGRVVAPQGRPSRDGSLGRPVWALEVVA